ncbi:hypothetical protein [Rhizobium oryzicola]|uniref:Holin n=1 Tax=Rhizobium oryzicola TaxID=1232668 RepID=A0ABT8SX39_9HYPH|nr:hypothetical protein [Rhizobium oryzicola]MDO1582443.1 hypothetical protein [Rhizobium oryzicola]
MDAKVITALAQAVSATVARDDVPAQSDAVQPIVDAVAPLVAHTANAEPWYQSRVTIGAIVSVAIPLLGALGVSADVLNADQLTAILVAAGSLIGGLITLYGRWKAKTPLGSK